MFRIRTVSPRVLALRQRQPRNVRFLSDDMWDFAAPSSSSAAASSAPAAPTSVRAAPAYSSAPASSASEQPAVQHTSMQGLDFDAPAAPQGSMTDWSRSFHGLSAEPFPKEVSDVLLAPLSPEDVEIKPDGILYLPEIRYRRILNKAFGPGGWGMAPRGEISIGSKNVSREYGLVCLGRLVSVARGEQDFFDPSGVPTASEGCKSNALMRCSKDLGIASELWDPRFIREFKAKHCVEVWVEHTRTKRKQRVWRRKDAKLGYPYEEK